MYFAVTHESVLNISPGSRASSHIEHSLRVTLPNNSAQLLLTCMSRIKMDLNPLCGFSKIRL